MGSVTRIGLLGTFVCGILCAQATFPGQVSVTGSPNPASNPIAYNPSSTESLTFTATVDLAGNSSNNGDETVEFTDSISGGPTIDIDSVGVLGNGAPLNFGVTFTVPVSGLIAGTHVFTLNYLGDTSDTPAGFNSPNHVSYTEVVQYPTTTCVGVPSTSVFGTSVSLQALVTSSTYISQGAVTFYDGATVLGTETSFFSYGEVSGCGYGYYFQLSTALLSQGKRHIWARYEDGTTGLFASSSSASTPLSQNLTVTSAAQIGFPGTPPETIAVPSVSGAEGVVVADFNGDGIADLAVLTPSGVTVALGNGSGGVGLGTFGTPTLLTTRQPPLPGAIVAADFEGTGNTDLAVLTNLSGSSPQIEIFHNYGGSSGFEASSIFTALPSNFYSATSLAVGDFNGDGFPDVVVGRIGDGSSFATVLLGNGNPTVTGNSPAGGFQTPGTTLSVDNTLNGALFVATADFNNDGIADVAVADVFGDLYVFTGSGNTTFTPSANIGPGDDTSFSSMAIGDLNGDGFADIVVGASSTGSSANVFFNSSGTFSSSETTLALPNGVLPLVAVGDFNGNGMPTVAVADANSDGSGGIYVFPSNGTVENSTPTLYATTAIPDAIAVGNFATHGNGDIVVTDGTEAGVFLGAASAPVTPPSNPSSPSYPAPTISTTGLPTGIVGQVYSAGLSATGGSGNYAWRESGLPATLSLTSSGSISGTPTAAFNGSVLFTVTDQTTGLSNSVNLTLSITLPPLKISGNGNLGDVAVGSAVAASFSASGGVPPYTWALAGGAGLSVDGNGNVRGAASPAGSYTLTLTLTDSTNTSVNLGLSLAVLGISGSFPSGTTTAAYTGTVTGVGGVPPYTYVASGVPAGLSFSGGTLSGQATYPGSYTLGVVVTDHYGVSVPGNFPFTITGSGPTTLTITTSSLANAYVGQPYSQTLGVGGGASGDTWTQSGGQMPPGLSLSSGGTISGTPTQPGTYSIGVQVTDSSGAEVISTISITILPAPLQITSGSTFPNGLVGVQYPSQILTASGGVAPYTFSVTGSLPGGLTLGTAQIGGTPTAPGTYSINVVVTDSAAVPNTASLAVGLTVVPNTPSLVLSSATASFSLTAGTSAAPSPSTISVTSSTVSQVLTFTATSSVPWLSVGGSSSTPGSITVGPNSAALALTSGDSPYSGTVTVTCTATACASSTPQTIAVTLTVLPAPPQLSLGSALLSFVSLTSSPAPSSQALSIVNAGGGSLGITSVSAGSGWISVGSFPSSVAPGPGASVTITANPAGLNPGYYLSSVTVVSSAGSASVPVTFLVSGTAVMTLGPAGTQFSMPQAGSLGNANGSFLVSVSSGSFSYGATVSPGTSWLSGGGSGTATPSSPGTVSFSINQSAAAALAVGSYYGTISVTGLGVVNAPQSFQVVLNISPAATPVTPNPEPAGLVFITSGAAVPPQTIQVFASSTNTIGFQTSASVATGSGWLSVSPSVGGTSAAFPASVTVTANPAGLTPGVYRGSIGFASASSAPSVNVTLIVQAPLSTAAEGTPAISSGARPSPAQSGPTCSGGQLVPTQTGLVSNFSAPASWPTPLAITLVDTCGNAIGNGEVVATFSNGDPPLILAPIDTSTGLYSGTWTPRNPSSQVTILARASVPGYTTATAQIAGRVAPNTAPSLNPNGTSDIFHPQVGAGLGPGNIVQIYGSGLAGQIGSPAVLPLPTTVNGTSVLIGGEEAPLYYVSASQINAQIPFDLTAGNQYQVIVSANGALTTPEPIQLTQAVPAILQFTSGAVVAQHQDGTLVSSTAPAAPGEFISFYLSGLGATNPPVATGAASPTNPPATVVDTPVLTLNDTTIPVSFAGLAPGFVGLYQINFQVPTPLANGNYEIAITQDGTVSNQTVLPVANPVQQ